MQVKFLKGIIAKCSARFKQIWESKRAETTVGDSPPFKAAEIIIKGTTYIVNSFFKKDAKGNVVDKVGRLIERDAANISQK